MKFTPAIQKLLDEQFASGGSYVSSKIVAGIIRAKLKSCFPGMKFKVVLGSTSSSIDVDILGGQLIPGDDPDLNGEVTPEDVENVVADYVGGGFDGMTDYAYNHRHWLFPDGSTLMHFDGSPYADDKGPQNTWAEQQGAMSVNFASDYIFVRDRRH